MIAIEIKAPIVNHRIDVSSDKLPSNVGQARIIVMYEEASAVPTTPDIVALARAARNSFPKGDPKQLRDEFDALRCIPLMTGNTGDFMAIPGLSLLDPAGP